MSDGTPGDDNDADRAFQEGYEQGEQDAEMAVGYSLCPYQYGLGTCRMGCHDEPACVTGGPTLYFENIADLIERAGRGKMTVGEHDEAAHRAHPDVPA